MALTPPRGLDDARFLTLYRENGERVLRFFARRTLDAQTAADLTSETFIAAFQARHQFDPRRGEPSEWLFGVARHRLSRYVRRQRLDARARAALQLVPRTLSAEDVDRIEDLVDFADLGRRVRDALGELSPDQREAVILRIVDGKSYADVADALHCSEETARARASRGLRALGVYLATHAEPTPKGA